MHQSKVSSPKRARMHVCEICYLQQETGFTVKPVSNGHSKIDKAKILMTNGSLMKVINIPECSLWSRVVCFAGTKLFHFMGYLKTRAGIKQPYCVLVVIFFRLLNICL